LLFSGLESCPFPPTRGTGFASIRRSDLPPTVAVFGSLLGECSPCSIRRVEVLSFLQVFSDVQTVGVFRLPLGFFCRVAPSFLPPDFFFKTLRYLILSLFSMGSYCCPPDFILMWSIRSCGVSSEFSFECRYFRLVLEVPPLSLFPPADYIALTKSASLSFEFLFCFSCSPDAGFEEWPLF